MKVNRPDSTCGRKASCWLLLKRCTSSTKTTVRRPCALRRLRALDRLADVLHAAEHRRDGDELRVEGAGHQPRQRRLADARRAPQDHRMQPARLEGHAQRLARRRAGAAGRSPRRASRGRSRSASGASAGRLSCVSGSSSGRLSDDMGGLSQPPVCQVPRDAPLRSPRTHPAGTRRRHAAHDQRGRCRATESCRTTPRRRLGPRRSPLDLTDCARSAGRPFAAGTPAARWPPKTPTCSSAASAKREGFVARACATGRTRRRAAGPLQVGCGIGVGTQAGARLQPQPQRRRDGRGAAARRQDRACCRATATALGLDARLGPGRREGRKAARWSTRLSYLNLVATRELARGLDRPRQPRLAAQRERRREQHDLEPRAREGASATAST